MMDLLKYIPAALRLMEQREDAEKLARLLAPIIDKILAIAPEALPHILKIWAAVRKEFPAAAATPKRLRKPRRAAKRK